MNCVVVYMQICLIPNHEDIANINNQPQPENRLIVCCNSVSDIEKYL